MYHYCYNSNDVIVKQFKSIIFVSTMNFNNLDLPIMQVDLNSGATLVYSFRIFHVRKVMSDL